MTLHRRVGAGGENLLIRGENLQVMRALLPDLAGTAKLVYIDPPFNTGGRFRHYRDNLSPEAWLGMMRERLSLLRFFLRPDGVILVHLDDSEAAYCKTAMDEIFGRENYITTIVVQAATPSSYKTVNPGPVDVTEFILMYCRDRVAFRFEPQYMPYPGVDLKRFTRFVQNPADDPAEWRFGSVAAAALHNLGYTGRSQMEKALGREESRIKLLRAAEEYALEYADWVFETKTLQRPGRRLAEEIERSRNARGVLRVTRAKGEDLYLYRGRQLYFLRRSVREIEGRRTVAIPLTNLWTDIPTSGLYAEGGVDFRYGKKPEKLMARLIEMTTAPGDLVLDVFAGSGTTGAVAHKLGRRWIMVERGEHAETHALARLERVIDGTDQGGISRAVAWRGSGGLLYCSGEDDGEPPQDTTALPGRPILVTAAVIEREGRVLVAQRRDNLIWEFPGGKVEAGEDLRAALQREIREELDLSIRVAEPLETFTLRALHHLVIVFFAAVIQSGDPRPIECAALHWAEPDDLAALEMGPADRAMARTWLERRRL